MSESSIREELLEEWKRLDEVDRRRVLAYIRSLPDGGLQGGPGESLRSHLGAIPEAEADDIAEAIEEGCEKVSLDAW